MKTGWMPLVMGGAVATVAIVFAWREYGMEAGRVTLLQTAQANDVHRQVEDAFAERELLARFSVATFQTTLSSSPQALSLFGPRVGQLIPAINTVVWAPRLERGDVPRALQMIGRVEPVVPPPTAPTVPIPTDAPLHMVMDIYPPTEQNMRSRGLVLDGLAAPAAAIAGAYQRRDIQATPPLHLVQLPGIAAFVVYGPVSDAAGNTLGILGFSYRFDQLFERLALPADIAVIITDRNAPTQDPVWRRAQQSSAATQTRVAAFAGRIFDIRIAFSAEPRTLARRNALQIALLGLLGSIAAGWITLGLTRLNRRLADSLMAERENQSQLRLLIGELNHRIGNVLALVGALARQTFTEDKPIAVSRHEFDGRIGMLARASALSPERGGGSDIGALVAQASDAFGHRLKASGPAIPLGPEATQLFALAIHELATNSMKHGDLSTAEEHVTVHWEQSGNELVFRWLEIGTSEALAEEPKRKGFGSRLLLDLLPYQLGGKARRDSKNGQFTYELRAPLAKLAR